MGCRTFVSPMGDCERRLWGLGLVLLTGTELAVILSLGVLVMAAELMNTAVERTVDLVSLERSELAKQAKDAASAGVALTATAFGVAWLVVLLT